MKHEHPQPPLDEDQEVFIALAAHAGETVEEPPSTEELNEFFNHSRHFSKQRQEAILAYLDRSPEAYERWIRQAKTNEQPSRSSFLSSVAPYAVAACAAFLLLGFGLLWRGEAFKLEPSINRSYQAAFFQENPEYLQSATASLVNTMEQAKQPLGFSQSSQTPLLTQAFIRGLQQNQQAVDNPISDGQSQEDYQLGRWYALLWSVSQQSRELPTDFWQSQLSILEHLQSHYASLPTEATTPESKALVLQLERMEPILQQLAKDSAATIAYRKLERVLVALRYSLIPSR